MSVAFGVFRFGVLRASTCCHTPGIGAFRFQGRPFFHQEFDDSEFSDVQMAELVRVRCEAAGIVQIGSGSGRVLENMD